MTGAKINSNMSSGLRLGAWKDVALPGSFSWTDSPVRNLGSCFRSGFLAEEELVRNKVKGRSGGPDLASTSFVCKV